MVILQFKCHHGKTFPWMQHCWNIFICDTPIWWRKTVIFQYQAPVHLQGSMPGPRWLSQIYRRGREKCFQTSKRKPHARSEEPVPVAATARASTSCWLNVTPSSTLTPQQESGRLWMQLMTPESSAVKHRDQQRSLELGNENLPVRSRNINVNSWYMD